MKRGTPRHPKVAELASRLKITRYGSVGLLEMLWHFTAQYALDGAIGRFSDDAIAEALFYDYASTMLAQNQNSILDKNLGKNFENFENNSVQNEYLNKNSTQNGIFLIEALVNSGWVDRCKCHRLRIHDWPEHADQTVKRVLAKRKQWFIPCYDDASMVLGPSKMPLPLPLPKADIYTCAMNIQNENEFDSLSGLIEKIAKEIRKYFPDYDSISIISTSQALRPLAEKIENWENLIERAARRWSGHIMWGGRDRLRAYLVNWFENEVSGAFKKEPAVKDDSEIPYTIRLEDETGA
jgi:hypothetical protein